MKLRYFIPTFMALVAMLVGCQSEEKVIYLDGLQVSSSYVALSKDGGSTAITLKSSDSWSIAAADVPEWLTISPMNGGAGETTITFSADAAAGRTAALKLTSGSQTQEINVIQGIAEVSKATCAEVIAGADSKTYLVTGVCTGIANTNYGNWYLNDGTGEVYIYGTVNAAGQYAWASFGIEVGDEVTVQGPKTTYNGTVELVDVSVVKVSKSLIKVDSLSTTEPIPLEGGELTAFVNCKGDGINVEIPEDAKDWLFISALTSSSVTFKALPNMAGDRSTTVTLKTYSGGKEYTSQFNIAQTGAIVDATIAEFNAAEVGETQYRITGVITSIANASYGNYYIKDFSGETYVYGTGAKGDFEALGLKEGDVVTIVGKRDVYKETIEMTGSTIENIIPVTEISITDFLAQPDDKNTWYKVTGTITSLLDSKGAENDYGNLYFTDGTSELYVYGTYPGWGATGDARKFFIADNGIEVGDQITIIGYKDTYKELVELCGGVCFSFAKANAE
ncbi:MAG: DNA-binding protein [Prevotella sp.]|nr:DNA-binding protein [Prevotella sp.]